jgi:hypothetical protein
MALSDRYPGADILAQRGHWDDATRRVILDRVHHVPECRYFDAARRATLEALCARIVPQDYRPPDRRIPLAPWIDARCHLRAEDGFRYDDMPPNEVAWDWGLEGLDQTSRILFAGLFVELGGADQDAVLRAVRGGYQPGEVWERLPARRWWLHIAVRQIAGTYYAHPYAWDEIGFGGPAYPRGYASLNFGAPEPWEAREVPAPGGTREGRAAVIGEDRVEAGERPITERGAQS